MPARPVPADPGRDDDPARYAAEPEGPWWQDDEEDEPPGELTAEELAEVREAARDQAAEDAGTAAEITRLGGTLGLIAAAAGRRGPGLPGSARIRAGESCSRAAAFGAGMALDVMPACPELALAGRQEPQDDLVRDGHRGSQGHAIGHGCARPEPKSHRKRAGPAPPDGPDPPRGTSSTPSPGFSFTLTSQEGPPGGHGTWQLHTPGGGPDLLVTLDPIPTGDCDHRFQARGHDPGVKLRHLAQVRNATCTGPVCRRPSTQAGFEHNTPYEAGGRTCLCNGGPPCKR